MQKISGITVYWFLWIIALSSYSLAAKNDVLPKLKVDNQQINDIYTKLLYFDSLKIDDSIAHYAIIGYSMCEKIDIETIKSRDTQLAIAEIYNYYGDAYYFSNDNLFESIIGYEKAAEIFKKNKDQNNYANCIFNLATTYAKVGKAPKSLDLMHEATSIYIDLKDTAGITDGYRSIAVLYTRQRDNERAQEYLNKAIKLSRSTDDVESTINLFISLAALNNTKEKQGEALALHQEALKLSEFTNDELLRALVYSSLGEFYKNTGELDKAIIYFDKASVIIEESDSDYKRSYLWLNYADYYFLKGDYQQAVFYGEKALHLSEEIKNKRAEYIVLNILLKIYEKLDNPVQLGIYQKRVIEHLFEHKDQLNEQINELETVRFKLDKQNMISKNEQIQIQLELEQANQKRNYLYIIVSSIFVILLTFSLIIYFRLRSIREYNKEILKQSEERKLLLQEVHHRVKNNFQIVSSMLRLQSYGFENEVLRQNFEEAVNRINAMAIIHNVIYRQEKFKDIDAKNYLERLVENLHKTGDSRIVISIDSEEIPFKIETLINLGIALNELITNSFKHAFNEGIIQPKIKIGLKTIGDKTYELIYKDNGVGIKEDEYTASFGMELIETIITNFDGEVTIAQEENWNTVIRITFSE